MITVACYKKIYFGYQNYRYKYDIPVYISLSTALFIKHYKNPLQRKMSACLLTGILRCAEIAMNFEKRKNLFNQ